MANDNEPGTTAETLERAAAATMGTGSGPPGRNAAGLDTTIASGDRAPDRAAGPVARPDLRAGDLEFATLDPVRYAVGQEIARGGIGRILVARDRRLGRQVAIKELLTASEELTARFEREARITARLQHPAIIGLLDAGTWPGGAPGYVMKHVAGASLDKVIAERPTLEARLGLLPNVIAAVDALAYAHREKVIHRDLKPSNVMVGEFGETVVIDWGLAKALDESRDAPDVAVGPYRPSSATIPHTPDGTELGTIMGTPAYMPIEQARGEAVDERSDVYALGAMLYHVLSGAPPYVGKTNEQILADVITGPPPPLDARTPGVPAELVTIVTKAMARDPADRYRTARQLADDLKKFQTGQLVGAHPYSTGQLVRRWLRRRRAPVAVAAAAIVVLGVFGVFGLQRIAHEQARSEQRRRDAETLIGFMLGNLREKLEPLGKTPLLGDVAAKAVDYFDHEPDDLNDADRAARATAQKTLADVLLAEGKTDQALQQYRAALAINDALVIADPTSVDRQHDLSAIHQRIGNVLFAQGDTARALAEYQAALAIADALASADPTNADRRSDLAMCYQRIGLVLFNQGDAARALAQYRAALAIDEALVAADPTNATRRRDLAISHETVGNVELAQGDAASALAQQRAAMTIREALVAADPADVVRRRELSVSHNKVGNVLLVQGDAAGALAEYRAAMTIREALAASDPTNADRRRDLSVSHNEIGTALRARGDLAGALAEFQAAKAIGEALAAADPTNADRRRDLSVNHELVGDALLARGDATGALAEYKAELAIDEALAASDPTNAERRRDVSISHERLGDVVLAQGDAAGAVAEYRAAMTIRDALAAADPTNAGRQQDLSENHEKLADALLAQGKVSEAVPEYEEALAIAQRLATNDPTNADVRRLATRLAEKRAKCCGSK